MARRLPNSAVVAGDEGPSHPRGNGTDHGSSCRRTLRVPNGRPRRQPSGRATPSPGVGFVHVLEYLWSAAWSFFDEADPTAEAWVADKAMAVLEGNARQVAAGIRRRATRAGLDPRRRANADKAATYLTNKADHLDYPTALTQGWPIATGIIEGACRHLAKDRMDLTGARWGLPGAEAILKLRALRTNGDFDDYWTFHLDREHQRVHQSRYADNHIPQASRMNAP